MAKGSEWNKLAGTFDTHSKTVDPSAADNIEIAWPVILRMIGSKKKRVVDFGCGTGGFCNCLHSLGFEVVGVDSSSEMLRIGEIGASPL